MAEPYSGIVTLTEFRNYLGGANWSPTQEANVIQTLKGTQQDLEDYLNRPLELIQVREQGQLDWDGVLYLSVTPVRKIIKLESTSSMPPMTIPGDPYTVTPAVMERDELITASDPRLVHDRLYPTVGAPQLVPGGVLVGSLAYGGTVYTDWWACEYIGGYNGLVDQGLKLAIMQVAARTVARNHDVVINLRGGDATQATMSDDRPKGWSVDEKKQWDRLKRRVVV